MTMIQDKQQKQKTWSFWTSLKFEKRKIEKIRTRFFVAYEISIDVVDNMANLGRMNSMAFQGFSNLMIQNTANKTIKLLQ